MVSFSLHLTEKKNEFLKYANCASHDFTQIHVYQFLAFILHYPRKRRENAHTLWLQKVFVTKITKKNYGFSFDILSMKKIWWLRIFYIASCNDGTYPRRPKTTKTSEDGRNHPVLSYRGSVDNHSSRLCNLYRR